LHSCCLGLGRAPTGLLPCRGSAKLIASRHAPRARKAAMWISRKRVLELLRSSSVRDGVFAWVTWRALKTIQVQRNESFRNKAWPRRRRRQRCDGVGRGLKGRFQRLGVQGKLRQGGTPEWRNQRLASFVDEVLATAPSQESNRCPGRPAQPQVSTVSVMPSAMNGID
jgi:hypothetical protein